MNPLKRLLPLAIVLLFNILATKTSNAQSNLDSIINAVFNYIDRDSMENSIQELQDFETRFFQASNHREVAMHIYEKYVSFGYPETEVDSFQVEYIGDTTWCYNIIATLEGSINPDEVNIIGGHWDSYCNGDPMLQAPGADDNATGTVAAMEIARAMKVANYQPENTIKFIAFDSEEYMLMDISDYGSMNYARKAYENNMDIKLMINNDMIGYDVGDEWEQLIFGYDNASWANSFSDSIANKYTSLSSTTILNNANFSDGHPFYYFGYPTIYFEEYEFSPFYHTVNDLVGNINLDYYKEMIKHSAAMLVYISIYPDVVDNLKIIQTGTGNTLLAQWDASDDADFELFRVKTFDDYGSLLLETTTLETSLLMENLTEGREYKIEVSVIDTDGNESYPEEAFKTPYEAIMDQGIALIDESMGGVLDPTDEEIDGFYHSLLQNYNYTDIEVLSKENVDFGVLSKYSSVIWHINKYNANLLTIDETKNTLAEYLSFGGNLLITSDKPTFALENSTSFDSYDDFVIGDFEYDFLGIDSSYITMFSKCNGAYSTDALLPSLFVDTTKTSAVDSYHLKNIVQSISPTSSAEAMFFYDTDFEPNTTDGKMKDLPIAVMKDTDSFKTVTLGFPLYYMGFANSKTLMDHILQDQFGEPIGVVNNTEVSTFKIYPNPVQNTLNITNTLENAYLVVYNSQGQVVLEQDLISSKESVATSSLPAGYYIVKVFNEKTSFTKSFVKH